ncbi:universal stress protein [uncultured Thiohalocapsa sp.]|uniref:universal stress protein n=1 Tax=uncultured Thiohalocapsa sp. TaxID=768990 RepID=UPI0025FEEE35|nr:universal stress protein [uncultured Thiohalocapsa sp.]
MPEPISPLDPAAPPGPVVAAVRFDEVGRHCLRQALRAAAHQHRPAIALHILHETARTAGLYRRHDDGDVLRPNLDVAAELLTGLTAEALADEPEARGDALRQLVVPGLPKQRIIEVARLTHAGLIVIGGRPLTGLDRLLRRDVTGAVLRRAPCPVMVVDAAGNRLDPRHLRPLPPNHTLPPAVETT